jgi:hypothetical protein
MKLGLPANIRPSVGSEPVLRRCFGSTIGHYGRTVWEPTEHRRAGSRCLGCCPGSSFSGFFALFLASRASLLEKSPLWYCLWGINRREWPLIPVGIALIPLPLKKKVSDTEWKAPAIRQKDKKVLVGVRKIAPLPPRKGRKAQG